MAKKSRPEISTADALMETAYAYYLAAKRLNDVTGTVPFGHIAPAFYLLTCFCLELSFKAVYKKSGASENDIFALSHNLNDAYTMAVKVGMYDDPSQVETELAYLVSALADQHMKHVFRYTPNVETISVPHPDLVIRVLGRVVHEANQCVYPMPGTQTRLHPTLPK